MIRLRVDEAAAIPLAVESASPVSMTVKEEFIDRGGASIQSNKTATPGTAAVEVTPDSGYDALAKVTVAAIPPEYIIPSGTKSITENGEDQDVRQYEYVDVNVPGIVPTGTKNITTNGSHDVTNYATASVAVPASAVDSGTKAITANGNGQDVVGYAAVNVNVPNSYAAADEGKVVSNGALVAQTSDTVTQNGTVDTTLIDELTVNVSGGGGNSVTGTFTIATIANNNFPTITHNLNTQKIAVLIYPLSNTVSADGGYQKFYSLLINANPIMQDDVSQWTFDWTGYNSNFSDVETQAIPITDQKLRIGTCHVSPWKTQNSWSVGGNPALHLAYSGITITDNTVKIDGGGGGGSKWAIGTYKYHIWKLG